MAIELEVEDLYDRAKAVDVLGSNGNSNSNGNGNGNNYCSYCGPELNLT